MRMAHHGREPRPREVVALWHIPEKRFELSRRPWYEESSMEKVRHTS
jgi:hypothetical protein